jgi:histidinol-phosphate aminotransferase
MVNWRDMIKKTIREKKSYSFNEIIANVKLNQNESPYDIPDKVKHIILERSLNREWNRYPSINGSPLRKALSHYLNIPVEQIIIGVGSDELLGNTAVLILDKDKTMYIVEPTFQIYKQLALVDEARLIIGRLKPDFSYPIDEMVRVLRTKSIDLFIIAAPNNPTGTPLDIYSLEDLIKVAPGLVIVDEAYYEFSGVTMLPLMQKYDNLIITRTFSKAFSLAGLRVGYLIASPEIINFICKSRLPFSVNIFSETAALTLLENPSFIMENVIKILDNKEKLYKELIKIPGITVYPSATNFFMIDTGISGTEAAVRIGQLGVAIRDVSDHPMTINCIRITVGTPEENQSLLKALKLFIEGRNCG